MNLRTEIFRVLSWLYLGLALTGCSWFGGDRPKPVERAEFDQLTGRVTHLEDVVLNNPAAGWLNVSPGQPPVPARTQTAASAGPARPAGYGSYQMALRLVRSRRYAEAAPIFEAMLAGNPQGRLAPNARYWLGECYYARGDFARAMTEFQRGFYDYPASGKAPDCLLKMSYSQSRLGDGPGAMETMRVLLERYPDSDSARLVMSGRSRFGGS
ncbi:MAG: tol-pal system protein YbgF [Deltaproteobacteria bacterium]|jgi:tol-pal system protein YbgF|nr:tol-pal system protein YbgF [Deltaproteobacteria bacterium]